MSQHTQQYSRFASLVKLYRTNAHMTQDDLGKASRLHFTEISKIERDERNPPKLEQVLLMIKALKLTTNEAIELLVAGNYPVSAIGQITFDPNLYPTIDKNHAEARLKGERGNWPVMMLQKNGVVKAINLLALVIWYALDPLSTTIDALKMLGWCVF